MRKLPVYLVIDTSGSMKGEKIEAVINGIQILISSLRKDQTAIETVELSVITFDDKARILIPLTELLSFEMVDITAKGISELGAALNLLCCRIKVDVKIQTSEHEGDWKPIVFILTDGMPTDDWVGAVGLLKSSNIGVCVACAIGDDTDFEVLKCITNDVIHITNMDTVRINNFFCWISNTITTRSVHIDNNIMITKGLNELPAPLLGLNIVK